MAVSQRHAEHRSADTPRRPARLHHRVLEGAAVECRGPGGAKVHRTGNRSSSQPTGKCGYLPIICGTLVRFSSLLTAAIRADSVGCNGGWPVRRRLTANVGHTPNGAAD